MSIHVAPPPRVHDPPPARVPKAPDWDDFYKNGLPNEIIVIEDSPAPLDSPVPPSAHPPARAEPTPPSPPPAKKQKTEHDGIAANQARPLQNGQKRSADVESNLDSADANAPRKKQKTSQDAIDPSALTLRKPIFAEYIPPCGPLHRVSHPEIRKIHDIPFKTAEPSSDDGDGHFVIVPNFYIGRRYRIEKLLGQGTFGKVVQAYDVVRRERVALKIIRSVQKYRDAARIELRVLQTLRAHDPFNKFRCIHPKDSFDYRGHICITMDLLDCSVFDFLKANNYTPFPNSHIQSIAHQLLTSVAYLHDLELIHTDLKPENILLHEAAYQNFTYNRRIPSSSNATCREATHRRVLLQTDICLIDFGSTTFQDEYHSSIVSTRHYRAPEIILGLGWSYPCDIWSIGCILVELFTGDALFQTHENREHLAMMQAVCDSKVDTHLITKASRNSKTSKSSVSSYFKRQKLDYPTPETTRASRRYVRSMRKLPDIIPQTNGFLKQFLDLLQKMLVFDQSARITAKEALEHPWFYETTRDDGTEAKRIYNERTLSEIGPKGQLHG